MSWTNSFANSPKGSNSLGNVDDEIRQLKNEIATFMARDHFFDVPVNGDGTDNVLKLSNQGRLKPGSAKMQSGVGAQMGFPTVRPDGTAFSAADDGRVAWVYTAARGLQQYVLYWKNDTDGYGWWPLNTAPVGTVMAFRGTWNQSINDNMNINSGVNTMPGWFMCDGTNIGTINYNFGVGSGTTQRIIPVPVGTMPDMRGSHLRGSGKRASAAFTSSWADDGVEAPKSAAFSKTLIEANLPGHQHGLSWGTAGSGKATFTVGVTDHPQTDVMVQSLDPAHPLSPDFWPDGVFRLTGPGLHGYGITHTSVDMDHYNFSL